MPEEGVIVPAGMVPLDNETGKVEAGYEEKAEELKKEVDETTTEEKTNEANNETTEATKETEETTSDTEDKTSEPVAEKEETKVEDETTEEDSSLHDEKITLQDIFEDYDYELAEGEPTLSEIISMKYRDLESLDPIDIIEEGLILEDINITDNELDIKTEKYSVLFKSEEKIKEMIDFEEITERELKTLQAEFDGTLRKYKGILQKHQEDINLAELVINKQVASEPTAQKEFSTEELKSRQEDITGTFEKYNNETLKVVSKEGETIVDFGYEIGDEAKTKAIELAADPKGFYNRWVDEDGSFNEEKYVSDIYRLQNFDSMMKAVYDQASSNTTEKVIKETNNITDAKRTSGGKDAGQLTAHDHLLGHYDS
jgi:hypothetical protein